MTMQLPRFDLGLTVTTPGALALLKAANVKPEVLLARHAANDWGDVCIADIEANITALNDGGYLISAYAIGNVRVIVFTAADRSQTTVLLREELWDIQAETFERQVDAELAKQVAAALEKQAAAAQAKPPKEKGKRGRGRPPSPSLWAFLQDLPRTGILQGGRPPGLEVDLAYIPDEVSPVRPPIELSEDCEQWFLVETSAGNYLSECDKAGNVISKRVIDRPKIVELMTESERQQPISKYPLRIPIGLLAERVERAIDQAKQDGKKVTIRKATLDALRVMLERFGCDPSGVSYSNYADFLLATAEKRLREYRMARPLEYHPKSRKLSK